MKIDEIIKDMYINKNKPFYGIVMNRLTRRMTKEVPLAAGNLKREILINPETFNVLSDLEKIAVLEHEILHFALLHFQRFYTQIQDDNLKTLANLALDCAINQMIINLPADTVTVATIQNLVGKDIKVEPKKNAEYYYNLLVKKQNEVYKQLKENKDLQKLIDIINQGHNCSIEQSEGEKKGELNPILDGIMKNLLQKAKEESDERQRKAGIKAGNFFSNILPEYYKIIDKNIFKNLVNKALGVTPISDKEIIYGKPNRRNLTSLYGERHLLQNDNVYIIIDTSASIEDNDLSLFLGYVSRALKSMDLSATIIQCDYEISSIQEKVTKINTKKEFKVTGRGGTDLTKALKWIKNKEGNKKCRAIVLTDGESPWEEYSNIIVSAIYTKNHNKLPGVKYSTTL